MYMNKISRLSILIVSWLAVCKWLVMRPQILVYSPDIVGASERFDPRVLGLRRALQVGQVSFGEILHTIPGKRFYHNLIRRRRVAWYLEAGKALPWLLRLVKPKQLWILDDLRYWHIIIQAARNAKIQVYAFQHGRFYPHMPVTDEMPTQYFVWNDYWRSRLIALSPFFSRHADRIAVGGRSSVSVPLMFPKPHGHMTVLLPFEASAKPPEIRPYIEKLLAVPDTVVIFKLRPDHSRMAQTAPYDLDGLHAGDRLRVATVLSETELADINVVLGTYTTMLYEMIEIGKPVGILKTSTTQAEDLLDEHLAELVNMSDDMGMQIRRLLSIPENVLRERAKKFRVDRDLQETLKKLL